MSKELQGLVLSLGEILTSESSKRKLIDEFYQRAVNWPEEDPEVEPAVAILSELASDLSYFEPRRKARLQDGSFFGAEEVPNVIRSGLEQLLDLGVVLPEELLLRVGLGDADDS